MTAGGELLDKQHITEAIYRYCHALDSNDRTSADTVWHEDGTADYASGDREDGTSPAFSGTAREFLDWVFAAHAAFEGTSHQVTNVLIECDGDCARSACYVTAALWTSEVVVTIRARYYDIWVRRHGRWAIEQRRLEHDLRQEQQRHESEQQSSAVPLVGDNGKI